MTHPHAGLMGKDPAFGVRRRAMIAADPMVCGIDRARLVSSTAARCVVDIHFIAATNPGGASVPRDLAPADVTVGRIGGARRFPSTRLHRHPDRSTVLTADFPPASQFLGGRPDMEAVVVVDHPDVDPLVREGRFVLAPAGPPVRDPALIDDPAPGYAPVDVDYLAKDYDSYRRLMLDTLATLLPSWTERRPADLGVAIVEILAYAADQLSYYQDAVATEAYLSTARRRVSLKRHARLLDYPVHQGCAGRAWVRINVDSAGPVTLKAGLPLLCASASVSEDETRVSTLRGAPPADAVIFETMADVVLRPEHQALQLHDWGGPQFSLAAGEVRAALAGQVVTLRQGDVVILAQARDLVTGEALPDIDDLGAGGGPAPRAAPRRHPVRLTRPPAAGFDPLTRTAITWISWAPEDAPTVDIPVAIVVGGTPIRAVSVVLGNIAPADIGYTLADQPLDPVADQPSRLRPRRRDLIHAVADDPAAPAAAFSRPDPLMAVPAIALRERAPSGATRGWAPVADLLASDRFARAFVVDVEDDGTTTLRFGDDRNGLAAPNDSTFQATYRVGDPTAKVGAGAINAWAPRADKAFETDLLVRGVWNPMPAAGGQGPVSAEQVRLHAPRAFRTQARCVIPEDYVDAVRGEARVADAVATRRWIGSWPLTVVHARPVGGLPPPADLLADLSSRLEPLRTIDEDYRVVGPDHVPVRLEILVTVAPTFVPVEVHRRVAGAIRALYPIANAGFAQTLYLSPIIGAAMGQAGVLDVEARRFERARPPHAPGLEAGFLVFGATEIPVLDDNPAHPAHGEIIVRTRLGDSR